MTTLVILAPVFFLFELWQLVMSERYVGIKQIARGADPRAMGPSEFVSFLWAGSLVLYLIWMLALLAFPETRVFGISLIAVLGIGYGVRSRCKLTWVLVTMTLEGAIRVGLLLSLVGFAWRHLH